MLTYAPWAAIPGLAHGFLGQTECAGAAAWDAVVARASIESGVRPSLPSSADSAIA